MKLNQFKFLGLSDRCNIFKNDFLNKQPIRYLRQQKTRAHGDLERRRGECGALGNPSGARPASASTRAPPLSACAHTRTGQLEIDAR